MSSFLSGKYQIPFNSSQSSYEGREWVNIQSVVRQTFKALSDVLKSQGDALRRLEDQSDSFQTEAVSSQRRITDAIRELERITQKDLKDLSEDLARVQKESAAGLSSIAHEVRRKADGDAVKAALADLPTREGVAESLAGLEFRLRSEVEAAVQAAATPLAESIEALRRSLAKTAARVERDGEMTAGALRAIGGTFDNVEAAVSGLKERMGAAEAAAPKVEAAVHSLSKRLERLDSRAQEAEEAADRVAARVGALEPAVREIKELRARSDALEAAAAALEARLGSRVEQAAAQVAAQVASQTAALGARVDATVAALDRKADATELRAALEHAAAARDDARRAADKAAEGAAEAAREEVRSVRAEMSERPTTHDLRALLDHKADVEEVNRALGSVSKELEGRLQVHEFQKSISHQAVINQSLGAEMCMGRWLWKSGKTKSGGAIPWNIESQNTDPANFVWEKGACVLQTVVPGLYEVTFGFFARKKPQVQLLVDGQPVLVCTNSSSYAVGSKTSVATRPHPAGTVTGLTMLDFLALPPKARLSIVYQGEETGEGFFQLKKL